MFMIVRLILLAVGLCAATLSSHAQIQFQRVYGGDSYDVGKEVIQTSDDGYLIVGSSVFQLLQGSCNIT